MSADGDRRGPVPAQHIHGSATTVYLADLRYNYSGVLANDCMPLGVGYMKAVMDRELPEVRSRLFAYPDRLLEALRLAPPHVLMLSDYVWNESLSLHFARLAKRARPETLVVMGGPNLPVDPERQMTFLELHPEIDVFVLGEGDFAATDIVRRFLEAGRSLGRFRSQDLPSCLHRTPDGVVVRQPVGERRSDVDAVPSPWLAGVLDEFFDGRLAPMLETNRGCPFTCTFCVQGDRWYAKVHNFSEGRLREEIRYIAGKIKERSPAMGVLRIADSNYGMYERDVAISACIGEVQREFGWPTFIDATTGKNRPDRIIKSLEQVGGALVLYQAVQSLDDNVLRNVRRQTIRLEAYEQLHVSMRGRGLRSNSDLILGLPGESLDSHLRAMDRLLDAGIDQMHNFQAMMLKGSEMESQGSRGTFGFQTRFRVLPKNFGVYGDDKVFDVEEIVVATSTLPFEDYLTARKHHLACSVFWNDSWFQDVVQYAAHFGVRRSEWLREMVGALERSTGTARRFLDDFVRETAGELFQSPEDCVAFYSRDDNFERLQRGEIGDNLMYKYRAIACFHIWPEISRLAVGATRRLLEVRGAATEVPGFDDFLVDLEEYVTARHAHGQGAEQLLAPVTARLGHDLPAWAAAGLPKDPTPFRLATAQDFQFHLRPEAARELGAALRTWTSSLKGLSKLVTRIQPTWVLREAHRQEPSDGRWAGPPVTAPA
jgi:radical SAM superfamily enzyme YgiQ (UPF0313 family)